MTFLYSEGKIHLKRKYPAQVLLYSFLRLNRKVYAGIISEEIYILVVMQVAGKKSYNLKEGELL